MYLQKITHGTFNQANFRFGESAGKQCACMSLYAISFSATTKFPGNWNSSDLDFVLKEGDKLYKSVNKNYYLMVSDLPRNLVMFESNVSVNFLENEFGFFNGHGTTIPHFLRNNNNSQGDGVLLFLKHICVAIIPKKNCVYVFDSHSRDIHGQPTPDGFSCLIKFKNKKEVENYFHSTYITETDVGIQYELQYISIEKVNSQINFGSIYSNETHKEKAKKQMSTEANKQNGRKRMSTEKNNEKAKRQMTSEANKEKPKKQLGSKLNRDKAKKRNTITANSREKTRLRVKATRERQKTLSETLVNRISAFSQSIESGPYYICNICNRTLYKKSVKIFIENCYKVNAEIFTGVSSFDSNLYICLTCHRYLKKSEIPPQAVWNKLELFDIPAEIQGLNKLEQILISKRILFKKIAVMHGKGEQQKIKGAICNIPLQAEAVSNSLPHGIDSSGVIFVKLKRKLVYKGHVIFEKVRPEFLKEALHQLKRINPFYSNTLINLNNISQELLTLSDLDTMIDQNEFSVIVDKDDLEIENPLSSNCASSDEICTVPNFHNPNEEVLHIAPGENKQPVSFFTDQFCEELAFPFLFPTGKFGYKVSRPISLTATKYFNQRLLNFSQRFSSSADYIFFAHYILQQTNLFKQINIATKKVKGSITAAQLQNNFRETVQSFICEDQGYQFMNEVKGTPAYWKHFLYDVLSMVKQLGLPSYFLTLSCADLRWDELVMIIARLNNIVVNKEELDYFTRCNILNQNPVLTARHFQYRVESFFKEILLHSNSPIGKVENYVIKVEFQFRGSPHIHAFLWLSHTPTLTLENADHYANFVDSAIRADLPDPVCEPELHELVSTYQTHSHSNSCRKYKNIPCRFNYGRFFTELTIIAKPLPGDMPVSEKIAVLADRGKIMKKVKQYIDDFLHPCKPNFSNDSSRSISEILNALDITEADYYRALSISSCEDFEIHYRRPPNSCFVNNYFAVGLMAWKANLDLQPVFNYYKAVSYMCSYFSKTESESSVAMKRAVEEATGLDFQERMKKLALVFLSHRQCSLQEAVYQVLPELWLRRCFPGVVFANTNLPEKRYRICKSEVELEELPPESTDVFKRNSLDRYMDRPNISFKGGHYSIIDNLCYAEFLSYYVLDTRIKPELLDNDYQPEILLEDGHDDDNNPENPLLCLPKSVPLMNSKEKLRRRNKKRIVRYHTPNPVCKPEDYAHHLLMLFLPFRSESDLRESNSYVTKLNNPDILKVVNENHEKFEPWGDMVDQVLMNADFSPRTDTFAQQENDDTRNENVGTDSEYEGEQATLENETIRVGNNSPTKIDLMPDEDINKLISTLNNKQRQVFEIVNQWSRKYVKNLSTKQVVPNPPLYLFITGGAGTGKSHLIKTITASVSKTLSYASSCVDKPSVLLLAPTGVAAVNINGTTIHAGLGISVESKGPIVSKIQDKRLSKLRQELSEVKVIIIDEISMVSNKLLLYVHQRLIKIFGCVSEFKKPFAGITMILVGDLYQLPPVMQPTVYAEFKGDSMKNIYPLWRYFQMCELTEVMRQKGDTVLIDLLNNVRLGTLSSQDEDLLRSRFIHEDNCNYPANSLHIFAENEPARLHNTKMLNSIDNPVISIDAIDQLPKNLPSHVYDRVLSLNQSKTGGLAFQLSIKIGAKVMLTSNVDISDKLINGQIGTVAHVVIESNLVKMIYVVFDNKAGNIKIQSDRLAQQLNAVPIERVTADIRTNERICTSPIIKRTQFPLRLSWGCTVHKVQGLSLNEVVISFDLLKQRSWNSGQMYVALSRVTSLQGLFLTGTFNSHAVIVNEQTKTEYQNLRENQSLDLDNNMMKFEQSVLSLAVSNVRSLPKHAKDLSGDQGITLCDVILCTETHLVNSNNTAEVSIHNFNLICNNDSQHRFSSLATYWKNSVELVESFKTTGFSIFDVSNQLITPLRVKILLLYRKKDLAISDFVETLRYLTISMSVDIVVGDFNLEPNAILDGVLSNYVQLVTEPTHLRGSILDHVYVHNSFFGTFDVSLNVKSVFFSDHEVIRIFVMKK